MNNIWGRRTLKKYIGDTKVKYKDALLVSSIVLLVVLSAFMVIVFFVALTRNVNTPAQAIEAIEDFVEPGPMNPKWCEE